MANKKQNRDKAHKVYAFIDGQNLHMSVKNQGWALDYARLRRYLSDKYNVKKAFLFLGFIPTNSDIYESLQDQEYVLIFRPTLEIRGKIKGNVDAELVLQAMIEFPNYDQSVIISGDGDFFCLVKYLKNKGKLLKLLVPNDRRYSSLYRKLTSYIAGINKLKHKLELKK